MEKMFLHKLFQSAEDSSFSIDYWDGSTENYGKESPAFKIIFNDKISNIKKSKDLSLALGEAYMDGAIEVEGDIQNVIQTIYQFPALKKKNFKGLQKILNKSTSLKKQYHDVQHHYDLGNDFYQLWLDDTMSYSCAYFCSEEDSLGQAQKQKIDHILKKLQLHKGETLLDIGSGWGWLIIRAAQQYGVKALGITLSEEQYSKTKQRIDELGLTGQVDVRMVDYRQLADSSEKFNKVVSVGMIEHVGKTNLPKYMEAVKKLLTPKGISVLHCITGQIEGPGNKWILKYIFPGGYIPSIRELIWLLPDYDFHLIDVESLRMHYARTLDHWAKNFEEKIEEVRKKYDERFVRMWRLYLNSCSASFKSTGLDIHQMVFTKGLNNGLPLTREHMYI